MEEAFVMLSDTHKKNKEIRNDLKAVMEVHKSTRRHKKNQATKLKGTDETVLERKGIRPNSFVSRWRIDVMCSFICLAYHVYFFIYINDWEETR